MALQTIQQRILDALGDTVSGVIDLSALIIKDWVNLGIRVIVGRTPVKKCKQLYNTAPSKFAPSTGMTLETAKLISVLRDDSDSIARECKEVLFEDSARIDDVNSLLAPSEFKPLYVIEPQADGTVKLMIYPASASSIGTASYVSYPEVDPNTAVTLAGFPEELEPYVDLYAVIQGKIRALGYYRKLINTEIDAVGGTTVISNTAFTSQTSVTVTHNQGTYPLVQILDTNGVEIGGEITHNSLNDFTVAFLFSQSGTIITALPNSSGGDLDSFSTALPTWSAVTMGTMPTVPTLEADASGIVALLGAIPTYDGSTTVTLADISTTRIFAALDVAIGLIGTQATDFITAHDTEEARESSAAAGVQVGIASEELKTELGKLNNWEGEYKSKVANFSAQIEAWLGRWKTFTDEDNLKLTAYKEEVVEIIQTYRADIENESIRNTSAIQKARSYLEAAQIRLGIVGGYNQHLALLPNEIVALQKRFDIGVESYIRG